MSDYKRVILVTGSSAGIGYSTVKLLASKGQIVYLSARNETAGKEAQQKLKTEDNLNVKFVQLDITDIKSVQAAKDVIEKEEGKLDVLVHNAGTGRMDKDQNAITVDINTIRAAFEPNFYGVIQTTQIFLPLIRKGKEGYKNILLISTALGSNTFQARPSSSMHVTAYSTSKAAANSYMIALAHELKSEGILVNCITPGITATKLNGFYEGGKTPDQAAEFVVQWTLLGPGDKDKTCLFYNDAGEFPW